MKFNKVLTYDASPEDVFAMLSDESFRAKVCTTQKVVSHTVSITPNADGFSMVLNQVQNTAGLPAIAKKIAGDTTEAVIKEDWKGTSGGSLAIIAPGKPTTATGTIRLEADGTGTKEIIDLEIKVKVPLIGGKLEAMLAEQIENGYDVEHGVGQAWLGGAR